jgi:hypothetical protein
MRLGKVAAQKLFNLIEIKCNDCIEPPVLSFKDYEENVETALAGVEIIENL